MENTSSVNKPNLYPLTSFLLITVKSGITAECDSVVLWIPLHIYIYIYISRFSHCFFFVTGVWMHDKGAKIRNETRLSNTEEASHIVFIVHFILFPRLHRLNGREKTTKIVNTNSQLTNSPTELAVTADHGIDLYSGDNTTKPTICLFDCRL